MTGDNTGDADWRKATASGGGNSNCVEVSFRGDSVLVRNSRDKQGPVLAFTVVEWAAFLDGARRGEFDQGNSPDHP